MTLRWTCLRVCLLFDIVGLPDAGVKESRERVKAAIKNCGFNMPIKRIVVNMAPADVKKGRLGLRFTHCRCPSFLSDQLKCADIGDYMLCGELSLDGAVRHINGALPMAVTAREHGIKNIIPAAFWQTPGGGVVDGINVFGARDLYEVVRHKRRGSFKPD